MNTFHEVADCISHRLPAIPGMLVNATMLVHMLVLPGLSFLCLAHSSFPVSITFFNSCLSFASKFQQVLFLKCIHKYLYMWTHTDIPCTHLAHILIFKNSLRVSRKPKTFIPSPRAFLWTAWLDGQGIISSTSSPASILVKMTGQWITY